MQSQGNSGDKRKTKIYTHLNMAAADLTENEKTFINRLAQLPSCAPAYSEDKTSEVYLAISKMADYATILKSKYPDGCNWIKAVKPHPGQESSAIHCEINTKALKEYLLELQPLVMLANYVVDKGKSGISIEDQFLEVANQMKKEFDMNDFPFLSKGSSSPYNEITQLLSLPTQRAFRYQLSLGDIAEDVKKLGNANGFGEMAAMQSINTALELTKKFADEINSRERNRPDLAVLITEADIAIKRMQAPDTQSKRVYDTSLTSASLKSGSIFAATDKNSIIDTIELAKRTSMNDELKKQFIGELLDSCKDLPEGEVKQVMYHVFKHPMLASTPEILMQTLAIMEEKLRIRGSTEVILNNDLLKLFKEPIFTNLMNTIEEFPKDQQILLLQAARENKILSQPTSKKIKKAPIVGEWLANKRCESTHVKAHAVAEIDKKLKELGCDTPRFSRKSSIKKE